MAGQTPKGSVPPELENWQRELSGRSPEDVLAWAAATFHGSVAFTTSLGLEDQVLTDMIARVAPGLSLFTLDTGRLFNETYDLIERTVQRYGLSIRICFPETEEVRDMVETDGVNLFRKSIELRKKCCAVRKVNPLKKELAPLDAWVVGLRAEQSVTRAELPVVTWDEGNDLVKISPLAAWSLDRVWEYIRREKVPYNPLHDQGFPSIGCASCTRAVEPGEDVRAGRWQWENPEHKECGLHGRFTGGKEQ